MNAFVTGATGFVGGNLAHTLLQQGHRVTCLARSEHKARTLRAAGARIVVDDLLSARHIGRFLNDCDTVFHVAGVVIGANRDDFFNGNLLATRNLIDAITTCGPEKPKVIYISSQAAAGPSTCPDFSESSPDAHPVSAYGASKLAAEREMLAMADKRPVVILRPSIVFGPGDRALLPLFRAARWGILPQPGLGDIPVNFVYVKDLVRAILLATEKAEAAGKVYFINDGVACSWGKWNETLGRALGRKVISVPIAKFILHAVCQMNTVMTRLGGGVQYLNADKWNEIKQDGWLCSSAKIGRELGFAPKWTLIDGMKETAAWYGHRGWMRGSSIP